MPFSESSTRRSLIHTRSVRFESYKREQGLSDTEGRLVDVKPISIQLALRQVPAGEAVRCSLALVPGREDRYITPIH